MVKNLLFTWLVIIPCCIFAQLNNTFQATVQGRDSLVQAFSQQSLGTKFRVNFNPFKAAGLTSTYGLKSIKVVPVLEPDYGSPQFQIARQDDAHLINWLNSQVTSYDPDTQKLQTIFAAVWLIKSKYQTPGMAICQRSNNIDSIMDEISGVNSCLGIYYQRCGEFWHEFANVLMATGRFTYGDFETFHFGGRHEIGQVLWKNAWIGIDPDPGTPCCFAMNDTNINGYATIYDWMNNNTILQRYTYIDVKGDTIDINPHFTVDNYFSQLVYPTGLYVVEGVDFDAPPVNIDGAWKFCIGCSLTWSYKMPGYVIDTSTTSGDSIYLQLKHLKHESLIDPDDDDYQDSASAILASYLNIPDSLAEQAIEGRSKILYVHQNWEPDYDTTLPEVKITVPVGHTDTLFIPSDISFPFVITDVSCNGTISLAHITVTDSAHFEIWSTTPPPSIDWHNFNFLQGGGFIPPGVGVTFTCAYNPVMYDFYKKLKLQIELPGLLLDELRITNPDSVNFAPAPSISQNSLEVYPNPATTQIQIRFATSDISPAPVKIFNAAGELIESFMQAPNVSQTVDVSAFAPGTYLLQTGQGKQRASCKFVVE